MNLALPRFVSTRNLALAATAAALSLAAFTLASIDSVIDRGFARAFATLDGDPHRLGPDLAASQSPIAGSKDLLLTRLAPQPATPSHGFARLGERITMAVDGARPLELEVIAIADIAAAAAPGDDTTAASRLVMVTCREVTDGGRPGRTIRYIVDADDALPGQASGHPARAL